MDFPSRKAAEQREFTYTIMEEQEDMRALCSLIHTTAHFS